MFLVNDVEQEVLGDDLVRISPLQELSQDLLEDCIEGQMDSPYDATTNFLEEFHMMHEAQLDDSAENDDMVKETKEIAFKFYTEILKKFDERFGLELDWNLVTDMNVEGLRNLAEGIYEFFIINYSKQVAKCISKIIRDHLEDLENAMMNMLIPGNVSTESYEIKLNDSKHAILLSNINQVVSAIKNIPMEPADFMNYFNKDKFDIAIMDFAIRNFIITGDFIPKYLYPIYAELQDDVYDAIVIEVHERLYQKFKKSEPITLEQFEEATTEGD